MKRLYAFFILSTVLILTGCSNNSSNNTDNIQNTSRLSADIQNNNDNNSNLDNENSNTTPPAPIEQEISVFSSKVINKSEERMTNLNLTAPKMNGYLIQPGEEFSFTGINGPCTEEKGYKEAIMLDKDGNEYQGLGGRNLSN